MSTTTALVWVNTTTAYLYGVIEELFTNTALVSTTIFVLVAFAAIRLAKNLWHKKV